MRVLCAVTLLCCCPSIADAAQAAPAAPAAMAAPKLDVSVERDLKARVMEWWRAREQRDHQTMYALMEPAYRQKVPFADFLKANVVRTRFDLVAPRIESVVGDAYRVHVRVTTELRPPELPPTRLTADDTWVRVSGQWWKIHQDATIPFFMSR